MLFNSLPFAVFFIAVLVVHRLPLPWTARKVNLLLASYLFYAAWNPPFLLLLWGSTLVDWWVAKWLHREGRPGRRKALLGLSLLVNLGALGIFKYGGFAVENLGALAGITGLGWDPGGFDPILPVGISFYTFQTMAYSLDVYLGRAVPAKSPLDFALFVTFFPQLVAGPIVRPTQLIPQFRVPRAASADQLLWGLALMTLGLFEKVVMADALFAPAADAVFGAAGAVATADAWLGVLAFSGQIFCDFAGYSTIAIGAALCLGFSLPDNFRMPYAAIGFSDFWRRWHISLSTWLRDYLYIPLGGNRKGGGRTYVNLMVTMLLGGLWHGASWTFVVWGGLHGLYLAAERWLRARFAGRPRGLLGDFALAVLTWFLVNLTWVFFRAEDFSSAWRLLGASLGLGAGEPVLTTALAVPAALGVVLLFLTQWGMRNRTLEGVAAALPGWLLGLIWALLALSLVLAQGSQNAFIYFQF